MRKRFEAQNPLDGIAISDVEIDIKSRHQLPALLGGLQYVFVTPELNEEIFEILEKSILTNKKETGRLGMSLWEIFVLGCTRLNMDMDYDSLQDQSNNHKTLRAILGVGSRDIFSRGKYYNLQTLKDNVGLLDEQTLKQINDVIVKYGHGLLKKKRRKKRIDRYL